MVRNISGHGRIRKPPGSVFFFRVLNIVGMGLAIFSVLLSLGIVLLEVREYVLRK